MKKIFFTFYSLAIISDLSVAQNVGIGVTNPAFKLDIMGRMRVKTGTIGNVGTSSGIWLEDYRDGTNRIFIGMQDSMRVGFYGTGIGGVGWAFNFHSQTGNVGIGVSSANNKLSVDGDIGIYSSDNLKGFIGINSENLMINAERHFPTGGTARNIILQLSTSGIFPATAGNVGIGTATPSGKLEVSSSSGSPQASLIQTTEDGYSRLRMFSVHSSGHYFDIAASNSDYVNGLGFTLKKDYFNFYNSLVGNFMSFVIEEGLLSDNILGAIAATPTFPYVLNVGGPVRCESLSQYSDNRFKQNIQPIAQGLDKILQLKAVSYDWKKNVEGFKFTDQSRQIGFLAQELENVIPEIVSTDSKGFKSVDYSKLTVVLAEAIKEQQSQILQQSLLIKKMGEEIEVLKKKVNLNQ